MQATRAHACSQDGYRSCIVSLICYQWHQSVGQRGTDSHNDPDIAAFDAEPAARAIATVLSEAE